MDDATVGDGTLVASLPDGRHIISLAEEAFLDDRVVGEANARLICQARYLLMRLLRDRERWQRERERLLEQIRAAQAAGLHDGSEGHPDRHRVPARPR